MPSAKQQHGTPSRKSQTRNDLSKPSYLSAEYVGESDDDDPVESNVVNLVKQSGPAGGTSKTKEKTRTEPKAVNSKNTLQAPTNFKVNGSTPTQSLLDSSTPRASEEDTEDGSNADASEEESVDDSTARGTSVITSELGNNSNNEKNGKNGQSHARTPQTLPRSSTQPGVDAEIISAFQAPKGFEAVSTESLHDPIADDLWSKSNLMGKEVWQITAPFSVPIERIKSVSSQAAFSGESILSFQGADYGFARGDGNEQTRETVLLADSNRKVYKCSTPISRTLHIRQLVQLPEPLSIPEATSSDARSTSTYPTHHQPKGLKMRYRPFGDSIGRSVDTVLKPSSSENSDNEQQQNSGLRIPHQHESSPAKPKENENQSMSQASTSKKRKRKSTNRTDPDEPTSPIENISNHGEVFKKSKHQLNGKGGQAAVDTRAEKSNRQKVNPTSRGYIKETSAGKTKRKEERRLKKARETTEQGASDTLNIKTS